MVLMSCRLAMLAVRIPGQASSQMPIWMLKPSAPEKWSGQGTEVFVTTLTVNGASPSFVLDAQVNK